MKSNGIVRHLRSIALMGVALASVLFAQGASALPVSIDATATGSGPFTGICSGNGICGGTVGLGSWIVSASVIGTPPLAQGSLLSNTIDVQTGGAGTISIFVNETGLSSPTGTYSWLSSFTANLLPAGWSVTELTCLANSGPVDVCGSPLSQATFNGMGTIAAGSSFTTGSNYTAIEEYIITATGAGSANLTIDLQVPEPGTLALVGLALLGFGSARKRKLM